MGDIGSFLSTTIYVISSSLLYPTLLLLVGGFLYTVLYAGSFCAELFERVRAGSSAKEASLKEYARRGNEKIHTHRVNVFIMKLKNINADEKTQEIAIENLLQEEILKCLKSLDRLKIMVRLGPSLGLMGTLIPMGTGLAGLSTGDMATLSSNLVIAFTTTVVGLAIGLGAYCIYVIKRRWIEEDIKNMELAAELISCKISEHISSESHGFTHRDSMEAA